MKRIIIVAFLVPFVTASSVWSFNGRRQGFVLGGGLGFGPMAKVSVSNAPSGSDLDNSGLAINFLIGYAWDEQNMIVFLRDGVTYSERTIFGSNLSLVQGFSGVGYFHYFGQPGKSFYITGGLGLQDWTPLESGYTANDPGIGLLIGGGYEFTRHVQVHSSLSFGKTRDAFFDYDHTQLLITVSAIAF